MRRTAGQTQSHVVNGGGIGIWALNPVHFGCTMGLTSCVHVRIGISTAMKPAGLKVLDTPSLLRYLAHETMHTSMLCWLCHCTHMNTLHLYIVHAHLTLIERMFNGVKVESCQIR